MEKAQRKKERCRERDGKMTRMEDWDYRGEQERERNGTDGWRKHREKEEDRAMQRELCR